MNLEEFKITSKEKSFGSSWENAIGSKALYSIMMYSKLPEHSLFLGHGKKYPLNASLVFHK